MVVFSPSAQTYSRSRLLLHKTALIPCMDLVYVIPILIHNLYVRQNALTCTF